MASSFERESFAALLEVNGSSTPGSARSFCSIDEEGPLDDSPRGPWHLEMAPLSSITPDENNQYYPGRTKRVEKKLELPTNAASGYKTWRQVPTNPKALRSLSVSDSSGMGMMVTKSRARLVSVPVLSEATPAQDHAFEQEEESSLFAAIFPETEPSPWRGASCKLAPVREQLLLPSPLLALLPTLCCSLLLSQVTAASTMQTANRPVAEGFGPLSNGRAIRNVLDFSLQDYYGGFSELMSGLTVTDAASPKATEPEPSTKTHSKHTHP